MAGWKFKYLQDVECPAELPIEMTAFKTQQARWAKGLIQTGKKILPRVMKSDAPLHTKLEAWYHLTANISYPLMIVLSVLLMPAMIIRSWQGYIQMLLIDFPLFIASTMSVSTFYLVSQKELFPKTWHKTFLYVPFLMALGVGLTITNTKAVMEALFGYKTPFARTPKYRVKKKGEASQAKVYRKRLGIVPWIELLHRHLLRLDGVVRHDHGELLHRAVPAAVCAGLLVHRAAEPAFRGSSSAPARRRAVRRTCTRSRTQWGFNSLQTQRSPAGWPGSRGLHQVADGLEADAELDRNVGGAVAVRRDRRCSRCSVDGGCGTLAAVTP